MPKFRYKVRDKFAKLISGTIESDDSDSAAGRLREMGYIPISISKFTEIKGFKLPEQFQRVKLQELDTFTRQLFSLQKAGVPILASLESIAKQTENKHFKIVIEEVAADVKSGSFLGDALAKQFKVFGDFYISMIKAAETGGALLEILERLCMVIEQDIDTQQKIKSATKYPMIAFFVLCIGFLIVVTFVIPRFATLYGQFGADLPFATRLLMALSLGIKRFWYLVILGMAGAFVGFRIFVNSKTGRPLWDTLKLKVPVFGKIMSMFMMARFARITAILMKSGVPILQVLDLVARTSGNYIIENALRNIREDVNQGKGMAEPMRSTNLFTPIVIQMVSIGEQTGRVDELLIGVADYYDRELGYIIRNLTTYIEPMLIFVLAIMVLFMALGIFMPMWNLIKVFKP
ncbi:MAG: type II secretion system F family protein [Candidatus Omnitrophota bacterium]